MQESQEPKRDDVSLAQPTNLKSMYCTDIKDRQNVHDYFFVREKSVLIGKNGKSYMALSLGDRTGQVDARVWDNVDSIAGLFEIGDIVRVRAQSQMFQGRMQLIVQRVERAVEAVRSRELLQELLPASKRDPEAMMGELMALMETIACPHTRQLVLDTLRDPDVRSRFLAAPAAKSIHHAYRSGLLEHVLSMAQLLRQVTQHYRASGVELNEGLLLFGAVFHDLGKIWELDWSEGISYSRKGRLLGHMALATELIDRKAARILGFPEELKDQMKHMVLSHHGRVEYGSPKEPAFIEAFILAAIDDFDSKINSIYQFVAPVRNSGEEWTKLHPQFGRHFTYVPGDR